MKSTLAASSIDAPKVIAKNFVTTYTAIKAVAILHTLYHTDDHEVC